MTFCQLALSPIFLSQWSLLKGFVRGLFRISFTSLSCWELIQKKPRLNPSNRLHWLERQGFRLKIWSFFRFQALSLWVLSQAEIRFTSWVSESWKNHKIQALKYNKWLFVWFLCFVRGSFIGAIMLWTKKGWTYKSWKSSEQSIVGFWFHQQNYSVSSLLLEITCSKGKNTLKKNF